MAYEERTPEDDRFDQIIKMEGLNIQSFHQDPPLDLFPSAETYPEFFNQNLVNPNRVLKQFLNDPQSNIRVFYLQLLRLAFEVPTDTGHNHVCLQNFKKIVFHPEFEILFTPDSQQQREIYNDFQFKKLFAQFISLLITASQSEPPSIEQALDQFPIIDIVLIHIIRSLLVSFNIKVAFDQKISTDLLFKQLSSVLQLSLTSYGNCWKFEQSDMFCYEQSESELYMAYIADEYYSQQTNNLQTIQSVQNEQRYIQDSFRSGYDNNLANSNSGRNIIIPVGTVDDAKDQNDGLRAQENQNWANELYNNSNNTFGDVKMRMSDNDPPPHLPHAQNYQGNLQNNTQNSFNQSHNNKNNQKSNTPVNTYNKYQGNTQTNKPNVPQSNYQPYQPPQTNTQNYQNFNSHSNYQNNNVHHNYENRQQHNQQIQYGPSYLANQPTVISNLQENNIDTMFSKIDNTLSNIHNQLAAPETVYVQNQNNYSKVDHSQNNRSQSYKQQSPNVNPNSNSRAQYSKNPPSGQVSSSRAHEQQITRPYESASERYKSQRQYTQSEFYSQRPVKGHAYQYSSINSVTASERYNPNPINVKQPQYFKFEPYIPPSNLPEPPIYKIQRKVQKHDWNQDFTSNDVLKLLRPEHRQRIVRIKEYFRNLNRGNDFPSNLQVQPSIARAASNVQTRSYGKSVSTYDSRPYSVANPPNTNNIGFNNNNGNGNFNGGNYGGYAVHSHSSFYS